MQKLVVSEVIAESAEEKAAATMPMVKGTTTHSPIVPLETRAGNRASPEMPSIAGTVAAAAYRRMPSASNSAFIGRKAMP